MIVQFVCVCLALPLTVENTARVQEKTITVHSRAMIQVTRIGLPPKRGKVFRLRIGDRVNADLGDAKITYPAGEQWRMLKGAVVRLAAEKPEELKPGIKSLPKRSAQGPVKGTETRGTAGYVGRGATFQFWSPIGNLLTPPTAFKWRIGGVLPVDTLYVRVDGKNPISKETKAKSGAYALAKGQFQQGQTYHYSLTLIRSQNTPVEAGGWFRILTPQAVKDYQAKKARHFRQKGDAFDLWIEWALYCEAQKLIGEAESAYRKAASLAGDPKSLDSEISRMHRAARGLETEGQL